MSKVSRKITPQENRLIQLKYSGKTFGAMEPKERDRAAKEVLLRIHVITGWQMPTDELMLILVDEFNKKIIESYPNVNIDEITHAFRQHGSEVKEWGKSLNISLIDEIMIPYLEKRFEASRSEERSKQIEYKPSKEHIQQIDKEFEDFLKTDIGKKMFPNG